MQKLQTLLKGINKYEVAAFCKKWLSKGFEGDYLRGIRFVPLRIQRFFSSWMIDCSTENSVPCCKKYCEPTWRVAKRGGGEQSRIIPKNLESTRKNGLLNIIFAILDVIKFSRVYLSCDRARFFVYPCLKVFKSA